MEVADVKYMEQQLKAQFDVQKEVYEKQIEDLKNEIKKLNKSKRKFLVSFTFTEIQRMNELVQYKIKNNDYGYAPILAILVDTPDEEFEEYQEVKICSVHDITKEFFSAKEENRKADFLSLYKDITDEEKADFI